MSIENRPYVGTWRLNNRKVVKHTPDALVYLNGDLTLPGCASCSGRIDVQRLITQVSVDPSTEGPATASFTMHIPRHMGDSLIRDGNFIIRPGLEVHIYMRGYFPTKGLTSSITPDQTGGLDVRNAVMYPYYMVFHGVITEVSHEYNGGEHTASISCADMLHFWQYQRMATSGSLFGARPLNSKVRMSLVGHVMTGMSPYAIIYQLYRDVQGSAGGVEFALGNKTNAAANSTVSGESLFTLSILYWQKRFSQATTTLRMYGANGTLYSNFQTVFLASLKNADQLKLAKKVAAKNANSYEVDPFAESTASVVGFDPFSTSQGSTGGRKEGLLGVNTTQLQPFVSDISQWGNVNFWESQYATKLEIANNVKEVTGYEFYQDVDGDIVFKPPFFNLDTSNSRVYRIEDIDIISFSASEKEPDATVVKVTGSHFQNLKVSGLDGEWGTRAEFIDYRLVAQFGWRQQTFETSYFTDPQAMYFACIARFDLFNIGIKSASCTIPIRPELRPGYPVYIVPLDCFFYLQSFNHSISFGGQCTTTMNLVGRRAKFYAPGKPPQSGSVATIDNITLNNMYSPQVPLTITEVNGEPITPRLQGFPNVVMTLDPEALNPTYFGASIELSDISTEADIKHLISLARMSRLSVLQQSSTDISGVSSDEATKAMGGPFELATGNNSDPIPLPSVSDLLAQAKSLKSATEAAKKKPSDRKIADALTKAQEDAAALLSLVEAARDPQAQMFPDDQSALSYLDLLSDAKASYNPGSNLPGQYRYYSSAHPKEEMQGPLSIELTESGAPTTGSRSKPDATKDQTATQLVTEGGTNKLVEGRPVSAGIPIIAPGTSDPADTVVTPTHQITTFQVALFSVVTEGDRSAVIGKHPNSFSSANLTTAYFSYFAAGMQQINAGPTTVPSAAFGSLFDEIASIIERECTGDGVSANPQFPSQWDTMAAVPGDGIPGQKLVLAQAMAKACASEAVSTLLARENVGGSETAIQTAWVRIWPEGSQVQTATKAKKKKVSKSVTKQYPVPVFPVSDERGYEVIGTYRYGRGLRIDNLGQLDGTADANLSYDEIEDFYEEIKKDSTPTGLSIAIHHLSASAQAVLAATSTSQQVHDILDRINAGGTQIDNEGANFPADTKEFVHKASIVNAAYGLADLSADVNQNHVCSCKGAEADVLLQAFDTDLFVGTDNAFQTTDTEEVQDWLSDQMVAASVDWAATQSAYRGTVLDTKSSGLFDAVNAAVKNYPNVISQAGNSLTGTAHSGQDALDAAQAQITSDLLKFGGG